MSVVGVHDRKHVLEEVGQLTMGVKYSRAIRQLYNSVIYVLPHGNQSIRFMTLTDSIENAKLLVTLLNSMQL